MPPDKKNASNHAAIVLAAGQSRRFGAQNKLLAPIDGVPMLARVLDAVMAGRVGQCILVTGQPDDRIETLVRNHACEMVRNTDYASGMGGSIARGISHVDPALSGAFVVLGDMPLIPPGIFDDLARLMSRTKTIARPITPQGPGHPVLFSRGHFPALAALKGDQGAGAIIAAAGEAVATIMSADPGYIRDFDTREAIRNYRSKWAPGQ